MTRLVAHTTALEVDDAADLLDLAPAGDVIAWLSGTLDVVGWGEAARAEPGAGADRFARAHAWFAELATSVERRDELGPDRAGSLTALGSFTFDERQPGSRLVVPAVSIGRSPAGSWITRVAPDDRLNDLPGPTPSAPPPSGGDRVRYAGSSQPDLLWLEAVAEAVARIARGDLDKVVLARDYAVWSRQPFDARHLARRLHARFPSCFTFVVDGLVGASPELLVRRRGRDVTSVALAGTTGRSDDPDEDARLGRALLTSDKDLREHAFAAQSVRDVLEPRCLELDADDEPGLLSLDNVAHLATVFRARLAGDDTALELAAALHPTAAVGGTPTRIALDTIRELERMDRGRYAGPVGWLGADGDGEWAIALRCAELSGARARLFAGNGIVAGSLPEDELEETRLKLHAMQSAFDG